MTVALGQAQMQSGRDVINTARVASPEIFSIPKYAPLVTAVPFVGISVDPRIGAMGDAGIGAPADANALFWNVAKTATFPDKFTGSVNYNPLYPVLNIPDLYLLSFASTYKFDNRAVSVFGKYMNVGQIQLTDVNGESLQMVRPTEFLVGVAYAMNIDQFWSLGMSGKFIRSSLLPGIASLPGQGSFSAGNAFALDVGVYYQRDLGPFRKLRGGIALSNMGNKILYGGQANTSVTGSNFLPANLGIGVGYEQRFVQVHKIHWSADINKLLVPARPRDTRNFDEIQKYNTMSVILSWFRSFYDAPGGFLEELMELTMSMGAEYSYDNFVAMRTGLYLQNRHKGARSFFSLGLGLSYNNFIQFNFSYFVPLNFSSGQNISPLANTLRFGVILNYRQKSK